MIMPSRRAANKPAAIRSAVVPGFRWCPSARSQKSKSASASSYGSWRGLLAANTLAAMPADWAAYRWRWEVGHLVHCALAVIAVAALLRSAYLDSVEAAVRTPRLRHGPAPRAVALRPQRRHIERRVRAGNATHNVVPLHYRDRLR